MRKDILPKIEEHLLNFSKNCDKFEKKIKNDPYIDIIKYIKSIDSIFIDFDFNYDRSVFVENLNYKYVISISIVAPYFLILEEGYDEKIKDVLYILNNYNFHSISKEECSKIYDLIVPECFNLENKSEKPSVFKLLFYDTDILPWEGKQNN